MRVLPFTTNPVPPNLDRNRWAPFTAWIALLLGCCAPSLSAANPGIQAGFPIPAGADTGELLLGALQCTACHGANDAVLSRVGARPGPVLGEGGLRLTPQWLRAWLGQHEATKPGSLMPDVLHGLKGAEKDQAVEALVHYLMSIQPRGEPEGIGADPARVRIGGELYHTVGCVGCHAPQDRAEGADGSVVEPGKVAGVPLGDLARKYPAAELARFLADPVKHRPSGRMPGLSLTTTESIALATYLLRDQAPGLTDGAKSLRTIAGLRWEYFEGTFRRCADLDGQTPKATGETTELSLVHARRDQQYGLRFEGVIEVSTPGEYRFWTRSDDGTTLALDGKRVVDNDGEHGPDERRGTVQLEAGPHTFELRFTQNGAGAELAVEWAGPGIPRGKIPAAVLKRYGEPLVPLGTAAFQVDAALATSGKQWFGQLNCAACHTGTDVAVRPAKALAELNSVTANGCLAEVVPPLAPKYVLNADERGALRRILLEVGGLAGPRTAAQQAAHELGRFNCLGCHERDGVGGPAATGRDAWFQLVGHADLGEEGRLPPRLDAVGGKLKTAWMRTVLASGRKVRPYMATRMPVFGEANVGTLAGVLERADLRPNARPEPDLSPRDAKYGRKLVGRDGLNCITCHTFTTYGSLGVPALGLENLYERVRWDWLRRYLPDPAALRPGTRMPTFWPEGRAANTEILGGDTEQQIHAIYAWLKDGPKADVPAGLVRSRQELVVDREAVIYRNFIEGAGSRAIGVGYPEKANLAFDANELRLALIWQGSFIDTSRHSSDRGVGFEPPLGDHVVRFPEGPAFATWNVADAPWPSAKGRPIGQQFRGYVLDDVRRPSFRYELGGVRIQDSIVPRAEDVDVTLVRTLKAEGATEGGRLWFRAAKGRLVRQSDGSFLWGESVRLRFRGGGEPVMVADELRVPIEVPGELVEEITW